MWDSWWPLAPSPAPVLPHEAEYKEYNDPGDKDKDIGRMSLFDTPETHKDEELEEAEKLPIPPSQKANPQDGAYEGKNLYFLGLVHSVQNNEFFCLQTLLALVCLVGQVLILNGVLFHNFVATVPNIVSWNDVAKMRRLPEEYIGFLAGLVLAPLILLSKLRNNAEFKDIAAFSAMLRTYSLHYTTENGNYSHKRAAIMLFWRVVHCVRALYLLPLFVFVNSKLMADISSIMNVLTVNVGLAFLLDLDNDLFTALYSTDEGTHDMCKKKIGVATNYHLGHFENRIAFGLFVMQMIGVIGFKFGETLLDLFFIPIIGAVVLAIALHSLKADRTIAVQMTCTYFVIYGVWIAYEHCYLIPSNLGLFWPDKCEPYVDPWFFFPNTTASTRTLVPNAK